MSDHATKTRRRILIGAGSYADAEAALRIAERLAETMAADLGGLLLEDTEVLETAVSPRQRVVTASGTQVIAPSRSQLRLVAASDARAFRMRLSRVAETRSLKWSFEQRSGELVSGLCHAAQSWDMLVIGHRPLHRRAGRVVLLSPEGGDGKEAADLAKAVATALDTGVLTLPAGAGQQTPTGEADMLARVSRTNAALVVTDARAGPVQTDDQLRRLLDAARCPVLVLGAGRIRSAIAHATQIPPAPEP